MGGGAGQQMADISKVLRVLLYTQTPCLSPSQPQQSSFCGGRDRSVWPQNVCVFFRPASGVSSGLWVLPYLHPFSAGAHVLAQEEAVQGDRPNQEKELLHSLLHDLWVQATLGHGAVEIAQLLQD